MNDQDTNGIEWTEDGLKVTLTGRYNRVDGWAEGREDLGLNRGGPDSVEGVKILEEHEVYYDEDKQEHVAGYKKVVLLLNDADALESATDRLHQQSEERFRYGMNDEAGKVQDLAGMFPSRHEAEQLRDTGTDCNRGDL